MGFETFAALLITGALGVGGMFGTFLMFILKGIKSNQESIASWARKETAEIQKMIRASDDRRLNELNDIRKWVRHWQRDFAIEVIELAKVIGPPGQDIVNSIQKSLKDLDNKEF